MKFEHSLIEQEQFESHLHSYDDAIRIRELSDKKNSMVKEEKYPLYDFTNDF